MALSDWSAVAADNATVLGVNIGEGTTAPSSVNNAIRQVCADVAGGINISLLGTFLSSTTLAQARTALGVTEGSASMTAFQGLTNTANSVPYMTGSDAWALATLTSFARTLIDDGDAATARTTLGAQSAISVTSNGNGSSINIDIGGTTYRAQFGTISVSGETSASITFPVAFSGTPVCVCSGGSTSTGSDANHRITSVSSSGATVTSSASGTNTCQWIALGT